MGTDPRRLGASVSIDEALRSRSILKTSAAY